MLKEVYGTGDVDFLANTFCFCAEEWDAGGGEIFIIVEIHNW